MILRILALQIVSCNNRCVQRVRFTTSARKHRIGKARVIEAMNNAGDPEMIAGTGELDDRLLWIGSDHRGVVLEVIGIEQPDHLLIIHAMPYSYRRKS